MVRLRTARANIEGLRDVSASTPWVALQQLEYFFHQKTLDGLFELYRAKVSEQQKNDQIVSDIEDTINEEALALRSWQSVAFLCRIKLRISRRWACWAPFWAWCWESAASVSARWTPPS